MIILTTSNDSLTEYFETIFTTLSIQLDTP